MNKGLCLSIFVLFAHNAVAQGGRGGIDDGRTVSTDFTPKLIPSSKLLIDPNIPKNLGSQINVAYNLGSFQWNTRKIARVFPPLNHYEPGLDTSYNPNYARIGGGNYAHKLLEGYVANRANNKYAYNFAVQHLSADESESIRDFSTTKGYLTGARFFKRSSLEMRVNYLRDMNRFFAKDTVWKGDKAEQKKINQNFGFNVLYDLKGLEKKPGFKAGVMFNNFYNNLNQSETEVGTKLGWDFVFPKVTTFGDLSVTYLKFRQTFTNTEQWFIDITPRVKYHNKETEIEGLGGVNVTWVFRDTSKPVFYLNPYIYGEKQLEGLKMKIYGGIDGGLRKNSIRRFSEMVPFTYDTIQVYNTYEQLKGYAGLKGRITENSQFNIEFGGNTIADMPLVVASQDSIGALQLVYDEVSSIYFAGDVRFSIGENLRVNAMGKFTDYTTKTELKAWHLPAATYAVNAAYNLNSTWIFSLGVDGMSKRYSRQLNQTSIIELKGFADINTRVDYVLNGTVRFWVQGSNLINQRYQVWQGYTSYRLTVLGGLAASF